MQCFSSLKGSRCSLASSTSPLDFKGTSSGSSPAQKVEGKGRGMGRDGRDAGGSINSEMGLSFKSVLQGTHSAVTEQQGMQTNYVCLTFTQNFC